MARGGPRLDHGRRLELGQSFQDGGEHYQRVRPGYPAESADWLVPAGARDAVDVGAGTGKFAALLLERGLALQPWIPPPTCSNSCARIIRRSRQPGDCRGDRPA